MFLDGRGNKEATWEVQKRDNSRKRPQHPGLPDCSDNGGSREGDETFGYKKRKNLWSERSFFLDFLRFWV